MPIPAGQSTFLRWFLSGRWRAGLAVTLVFGAAIFLPILLLPLWVGLLAMIALVTVQAGRRESLEVLLISGTAIGVLSWKPQMAILFAVAAWLPGRILGEGLRFRGWSTTLWALAAMGSALLAVCLWILPQGMGAVFWQKELLQAVQPLRSDISLQQFRAVRLSAPYIPGMLGLLLLLAGNMAAALASRWKETLETGSAPPPARRFQNLEVPEGLIWALAAVLAGGLMLPGQAAWACQNLVLFLGGFYLLQGLSLIHLWIAIRGWPAWSLLVFYLVMVLLSQLVLPVTILGILDRFFHWHGRLASHSQQ